MVANTHSNLRVRSIKALSGHVLLAEDNPVNQAVAIGMLETLGLTVIVASNGREAVAKAAAETFNVILMDCQMPGMDGFEATDAIRSQEIVSGKFRTPIIAVTANALKGDRERCLLAMSKSFNTPSDAGVATELNMISFSRAKSGLSRIARASSRPSVSGICMSRIAKS